MIISENVALAGLTTLGVGGAARFLLRVTEDEVPAALEWCGERRLPWMVLGAGSNLLVSDAGWPGAVLQLESGPARDIAVGELDAAAGADWDGLVADCVQRGWAGIECLSGIPGTVGATPIQNVGAYGQEVASVLQSVRAWDSRTRAWAELNANECGFGYRASRFNGVDRGRFVITRVRLQLAPGGAATIRYPELKAKLTATVSAGLADVRQAVLALRRSKSMVLDAADPESRSAGSFFKNPVVSREQATAIAARAGGKPPQFPAPDGSVKIPAAWLLEHAGYGKGFSLPGSRAGLSRNHVLAIVNRGGATVAEIRELARTLQAEVARHFGVELAIEPEAVGF